MGLGRVYSSGGLQGLHQQYISFTGSFSGSRLLVVHPVLSCCFPAYKSAHTYVSGLFKDHMYVGSSMTLFLLTVHVVPLFLPCESANTD